MNDASESPAIETLQAGQTITGFYVVRKSELKTKRDGSPYLLLNLGDATGRIPATLWDQAKVTYESIQVGNIVKVLGSLSMYNDSLQMTVEKIRRAEDSDPVKQEQFLKKGSADQQALLKQLECTIQLIKNPHLKKLLEKVFHNSKLMEEFQKTPGGKLWHHAYVGGLFEHTMAVVSICETMTKLYPNVDRDLLITGALLHDIGKIDEYSYDQGFFDFTDEGRLLGHISIGAQKIRTLIEEMEKDGGFPPALKKLVIHMILSHQGKLEHGSPVLPATLEAMILYYADEMDSKANAVQHIIERDSKSGKTWSQYINLLDRFIYLGEMSE